jgi:O-antigen/teichoic acid export membrane protein
MNKRSRELAINTAILGIGQLVPKLVALIIMPLLTAYLSTDEYGTYDLVLSVASLLIPLMTLQIQQAVFRYLLVNLEKKSKEEYVTSALLYVVVSSMVILSIVFFIMTLFRVPSRTSMLICLFFFSETIYTLLGQIIRGLGNNIKFSIGVIVYASSNLLFIIIFIVVLKLGLYGVIASTALGYLCSSIYMFFCTEIICYASWKSFSIKNVKKLLAFSVPIVPSSIALWVVNLSDRILIIEFLGTSANGIYAVANKIPTLYNSVYNVFNLAWTETASRVSDDGEPAEYYSNLFKNLFNFLIGSMLLMVAVTPLVFIFLVKGNYGTAIKQVPILYFGAFFGSFVNYYSGIYIALKRTKQVGVSSIFGAILNLIINFSFINEIGLYASSISTVISFLVIVLYRAYDLNKVIKIRYDIKNILVGMSCFFTASILLYGGKIWELVICYALAIIYNIKYNMRFVSKIFKIIRYR